MQKHLQRLLLLVAMMVVPWVTQGQSLNYSCTFEGVDDTAGWVFVNGTQTNKWFIGSATSNGGTNSLYISNDNGTSNAYTNSSISFVYAYREFTLGAGGYTISYDWKCYGESNYDYIRVFLAPATFDPTAGQDPTGGTSAYSWSSAPLPAGFISLCGANKLNQESNWQNFYQDFNVLTAGTYRLVFAWANDGSGGTLLQVPSTTFSLCSRLVRVLPIWCSLTSTLRRSTCTGPRPAPPPAGWWSTTRWPSCPAPRAMPSP